MAFLRPANNKLFILTHSGTHFGFCISMALVLELLAEVLAWLRKYVDVDDAKTAVGSSDQGLGVVDEVNSAHHFSPRVLPTSVLAVYH